MRDSSFIKLTDIADVISGYAFDSKWFGQGKKKIVRITDLVGGKLDLDNAVTFDHCIHFVSDQYVAKNQDVLMALSGATTGKIGVVTSKDEGVYVNQRVAIVRGKTEQAKSWLPYLLVSDIAKKLVLTAGGAAQPNLSVNDLKALPVPNFSLDQQSQIATKLKAQFAEVATARKALELQQQEIVNLANAYIRESIEQSPIIETRLGEVLEEIKKGIGETWADYPVLGATRGGLAPAKEPPGKQPQRYKPVFCGTVFYNPMRILIGSIAFVDNDDEPGITSPDYVALQGKAELVDSRWFYYWLRSPYGEQCINSLARGAVRERMLFNRLAEGSILLPSYPEQLRVSKALATLKPVKYAIKKQLNELNKIPERLLAQAFDPLSAQ
jgi:type I restriction enzyme S subunit